MYPSNDQSTMPLEPLVALAIDPSIDPLTAPPPPPPTPTYTNPSTNPPTTLPSPLVALATNPSIYYSTRATSCTNHLSYSHY